MTIGRVHLTKHYARFRMREPNRFIHGSFRTQTLGKNAKRIAGRLKTTGQWKTQAFLIKRGAYEKGFRLKKMRR